MIVSDQESYYDLLGLPEDATPDEVRVAYFEAARRFHPDANPDPASQDLFLQIQRAYEVLSNSLKRSQYDQDVLGGLNQHLSINVIYSRSNIPHLNENQLFYALVEIEAIKPTQPAQKPPLNICLVIDRSTSMKGERMDMVKGNIINLLKRMDPADSISIVTFSDRAEVILSNVRVSEIDRMLDQIHMMTPSGGTEIYQGLEAGYEQLKYYCQRDSVGHLFLLTDGHTYGDEEACLNLARHASTDGIVISALGIGTDWNDQFLDRLTSLCGGSTAYVSSREALLKLLEKKINTMGLVSIRNLRVELEPAQGVEFRYGVRLLPEVGHIPLSGPIVLGNLQIGRKVSIMLEYLVPPIHETGGTFTLASGMLAGTVLASATDVNRKIRLRRPILAEKSPEMPPSEIIDAMSMLTLYRLQDRARMEVQEGNFSEAAHRLQYLATHLLSHGDRDLAQTVLREADQIITNHAYSSEGEKKIKYGTRSLMQLVEVES